MSKQAWVGLFTLFGLFVLFGIFYVLSDYGTRARGYKIGVHFDSAAGLRPGAVVYLSGVPVGTVDTTQLQPDYTVDVILAIAQTIEVPRSSKFIINAPLTGDPILLIVPPRKPDASLALLPKHVLPLSDQPQGTNPATLEDLLEQGQGEIKKVDQLLDTATRSMPRLLGSLQNTLDNANKLTLKANSAFDGFTSNAQVAAQRLQGTLDRISRNFDDMSSTLDVTVKRNSGRFDALLTSLTSASAALASTVNSLHEITGDPRMHENIVATTQSLADTTAAIAGLANNLRDISGNPQSQAHLRDTFANLDASSQKLNSLLGTLGGRSNIPGIDGVLPVSPVAPVASAAPRIPVIPVVPVTPEHPRSSQQSALPPNVALHMERLAKSLLNVQVRLSELSKQTVPTTTNGGGSPLFTDDRGPQTDVNLHFLPHSSMSFLAGANDIGAKTTYNALGEGTFGGLRLGGGVLYSRLGFLASGQTHHLGFETRLYDPRNLTLDAYGRLILNSHLELFGGQRDIFHADRRTVFGLQATIP
jgi:ABC-type transporter Mla subunit MlaD